MYNMNKSINKNKNFHKFQKTAIFALLIILFFLVFQTIFNYLIPLTFLKSFVANITIFFLQIFNIPVTFFQTFTTYDFIGIQTNLGLIEINELCIGTIELFLISAAILATFSIDAKKKLVGIVGAFFVILSFNIFRILIIIFFILSKSFATADFLHGTFFRLGLLIVILVYYYYWYNWSTGKIDPKKYLDLSKINKK